MEKKRKFVSYLRKLINVGRMMDLENQCLSSASDAWLREDWYPPDGSSLEGNGGIYIASKSLPHVFINYRENREKLGRHHLNKAPELTWPGVDRWTRCASWHEALQRTWRHLCGFSKPSNKEPSDKPRQRVMLRNDWPVLTTNTNVAKCKERLRTIPPEKRIKRFDN